jgi:hypothetical protein
MWQHENDLQGMSAMERKQHIARSGVTKYDWMYLSGGTQFKYYDVEDIIRFSVLAKTKAVLPSLSDKVKAVKDELQRDPYNMQVVKRLGVMYTDDFEWEKAANVMLRGWKRVGELSDRQERFEFLMKLAEASYRNFQFKQASAVLMDVELPEDPWEKLAYYMLCCHVRARSGEGPQSLQAFTKSMEGEGFEAAVRIWAISALSLKIAGTFEVGKNALHAKVRSGQNKSLDEAKLKKIERIVTAHVEAKEKEKEKSFSLNDELAELANGKPSKKCLQLLAGLILFFILVVFYWLEQRSLRSNKIIS